MKVKVLETGSKGTPRQGEIGERISGPSENESCTVVFEDGSIIEFWGFEIEEVEE